MDDAQDLKPNSTRTLSRRQVIAGLSTAAIAVGVPRLSWGATNVATYRVTLLKTSSPVFTVEAELPIDGASIKVSGGYPMGLPAMDQHGWTALISDLEVTDSTGQVVATADPHANEWQLQTHCTGNMRLKYRVDFGPFAEAHWPSPLESAFADEANVVVIGKPLFLTTDRVTSSRVEFLLPANWQPVPPWRSVSVNRNVFEVETVQDLTDNMLVFSTRPPDVVTAAGFRLQIIPIGHWEPLRPLLKIVLHTIIQSETTMMGYKKAECYNIVLLPMQDTGGSAYRQSFAYTFTDPSEQNRDVWANTLAHEIFHYWNYARLQGADYSSTQWFQEGFTEYIANLTLVEGGITDEPKFVAILDNHIANYRKLTTTLENYGTQKGPPLYSAGALVAFSFDVMIRHATASRNNLGTFFRQLWRITNEGAQKYSWTEIERALTICAPLDWQAFYVAHIRGTDPLPLDHVLSLAGHRLDPQTQKIIADPSADAASKNLWHTLVASTNRHVG